MKMDSPFYSQDEFDLNLPAHHSHLKEKFNFLLERSIASTKGSPLNTPEPSVFDFKSTCKAFNLKKNEKRQRKTTKKMNVFDENVKILDIVETKASNSNLKNSDSVKKKIQKLKGDKKMDSPIMKPPVSKARSSKMKWSEDETSLFYRSLEQYGTDFSIISHLFKNRDRIQIKNKFLKEERMNPEKVHFHLNNPKKKHNGLNEKLVKFHDMFMNHLHEDKHGHDEIPHFTLDEFKGENQDHDHLDHKIHHHVIEIIKNEGDSMRQRRHFKNLEKNE